MSKFKVPSVPATTNKTVRFPNDIIERVEKAIINQDSYFSACVIAAVRKALEEVESEQYSSKE